MSYHNFKIMLLLVLLLISYTSEASEVVKPLPLKNKHLSLNFQNIPLRSLLELLAEFSGTNMVVSDGVSGSITLRLKNMTWQQALDIIIKTHGLAKRTIGTVMVIAPIAEMAAIEQLETKSQQLVPLQRVLIQLNYAKAADMARLLRDKQNNIMTLRGNASIDTRTNMIWIEDTQQQITVIRKLIHKLDKPVKQVLIGAKIVIIDKNYEKDLGINFNITPTATAQNTSNGSQNLNVDLSPLPQTAVTSAGLALATLGTKVLLDLELSALESDGKGEIISNPQLITANQQTAVIETGEEIPYQQATLSGATAVAFKKAVLSLKVTPQITPDNKILMDLTVNQDSASVTTFNGVPSILTREIKTQVLANNGETLVLGGIYKQDDTKVISRVPFLGELPVIGALFTKKSAKIAHEELLIFISPKIVQQSINK